MCFALGRLIIKGPPKPSASPRGSMYNTPRPIGYASTVDSDELTVLPPGRYARNRASEEIVAVALVETRTSVLVMSARERDALKY
jgi:hypothetical protein